MNQTPQVGNNVTGISTNASLAEEMQRGMENYPPTSVGTREGAGKIRIQYAKEGLPVGSIPKPAEVKEKLKALVGAGVPPVLLDKLGARMAFERTGTRLYEALLSKYEAYGSFDGGPERDDLLEILNEEHRHFSELGLHVRMLGGDPTAVTPSANLAAVASEGVLKVVTDPRTTLLESLEGVLIAELVDNDCWHVLSQLAKRHGLEELIALCQEAEATEQRHLDRVRAWLAAGNTSA